MQVDWQEGHDSGVVVHRASYQGDDEALAKQYVDETIEKIVSVLVQSVRDNSLYCLFEWNTESALLSVVVTDETKTIDSPIVVQCQFVGGVIESEVLRFWIRDYLTTCSGYGRVSLVAVYHDSSRDKAVVL